mmetsp:Transcript_54621/g.144325  ORF Transcript_54621/g.144325 Transcript_54621/m.144325 type:complete len:229 (+) Transcript_54621:109-795(+)
MSENSIGDFFIFTVAPVLAVIFSEFLAFGPLRAILDCRKANSLGEVNPLPFPILFGNGLGWLIYSVATKNIFVFLSNITAPGLSIFYLMTAHTLTTSPKTRLQMEAILIFMICLWGIVGFSAAMMEDRDARSSVIGTLCNSIVLLLFASPLSTLSKVVRTRSSASINRPFAVCQVLNCVVWITYGAGLGDFFIALPSVVGLALGAVQLLLLFKYPASPPRAPGSAPLA